MEKLMKIWLFLFTIYLILYVVDMIGDRDYGRYVSIGQYRSDEYLEAYSIIGGLGEMEYKILDKRTGEVKVK